MNKTEVYQGFIITWQEPPQSSAKWTANVATDDRRPYALMGQNGSEIIDGRTRDDMIAKSKQYIDSLLNSRRGGGRQF
jgi:hypothetical protein